MTPVYRFSCDRDAECPIVNIPSLGRAPCKLSRRLPEFVVRQLHGGADAHSSVQTSARPSSGHFFRAPGQGPLRPSRADDEHRRVHSLSRGKDSYELDRLAHGNEPPEQRANYTEMGSSQERARSAALASSAPARATGVRHRQLRRRPASWLWRGTWSLGSTPRGS